MGPMIARKFMDKAAFLDFTIEIIWRSHAAKSFAGVTRRMGIRLDDLLGRLVKDYEQRMDGAETMIHIAMRSLLLRRNVHR